MKHRLLIIACELPNYCLQIGSGDWTIACNNPYWKCSTCEQVLTQDGIGHDEYTKTGHEINIFCSEECYQLFKLKE